MDRAGPEDEDNDPKGRPNPPDGPDGAAVLVDSGGRMRGGGGGMGLSDDEFFDHGARAGSIS